MSKNTDHFMRAREKMMAAIDAAEGMTSRHLECFHFNFFQLTSEMIVDARKREIREEAQKRYPMARKDWGAKECPQNDEMTSPRPTPSND